MSEYPTAEENMNAYPEDSTTSSLTSDRTLPSPRTRPRTWKIILAVILALLALFATATGVLAYYANKTVKDMQSIGSPFESIPEASRPKATPQQDGNSPVNFLIMGSDSRISAGNPKDWKAGAQRTDALMVLQLSADRKNISIMSIPRDSWVDIPGHGTAKINAAFSYGGPSLTIQTVEQLTGIRIDHIALVDFTSFTALTDLVGGVDMTSQQEGTKHYDGKEALKFVRERYSLAQGDFDRVRRQQLWMSTVLKKLLTKETLSSPSKISSLVSTLSSSIATDDSLDLSTILTLGSQMASAGDISLLTLTAPYAGTGTSADGQSIVNLDYDRLPGICKAFQEGTVPSYVQAHQGELETLNSRAIR